MNHVVEVGISPAVCVIIFSLPIVVNCFGFYCSVLWKKMRNDFIFSKIVKGTMAKSQRGR